MSESTDYCIVVTRKFYGPEDQEQLLCEENAQGPQHIVTFESGEAAQDWIDTQDEQEYHLSHNESSRPEYEIVEHGDERFCEVYPLTFGGLEY